MNKGTNPDTTKTHFTIANGDQIPKEWGAPREAMRRTTVSIREPEGRETFPIDGGTLIATPGLDWIIVQPSGKEYPIKKDIFAVSYEEVDRGKFRKKVRSQLIQVPKGVFAVLATREGQVEVGYPDYVVIGQDNEVYANSAQWVAENLSFL